MHAEINENSVPAVVSIRRNAVRRGSSLRLVWYVADGRPRARWIEVTTTFAERKTRSAKSVHPRPW